ncbi:DUF3828 domain-containing protein [Brevundimonas sp.]|uniref:DUF3828 domain-containing protein n=1 Tax=Brevundimonas sp. TaxID=1871086 RepID=UPI00289E90C9|nr:DUF3828 domain-containing protein [Brevundimonas sp.]
MKAGKIMGALAVLALGAGVMACSQEPATGAAADSAAAAPQKVGREGAYEAALGTPEQFVRALYDVYKNPPTEPVTPGRDYLIQRSLNAMILYDNKNAQEKGTPRYLKNDPICDCNGGEVVLTSVQITPKEANFADAAVAFTVDGTPKDQTLVLEKEGGRWKVKDVLRDGEKPLTEQLLAVIG